MKVNITGPESLFRPTITIQGQVQDNPLWPHVTLAASRGFTVEAPVVGGEARLDGVRSEFITTEMITAIVGLGGDIENYSRFIEVPDGEVEVPNYLPNSSVVTLDEDGAEVSTPVQWKDYHGPNHTIDEIGGKLYVSTHSFGTDMLGSAQAKLESDGYKLLTTSEYVALRSAAAPEAGDEDFI
jgi:hypothetical protein